MVLLDHLRGVHSMNWIERWQEISARIVGLMEASNFLIETYKIENQNTGAVRRLIGTFGWQ
jgi:hypothetical protein